MITTRNTNPITLSTALLGALLASGCAQTTHPVEPSPIGVSAANWQDLLGALDVPGPITVETIVVANWEVERSGLINLDHPRALEEGIEDGMEPIEVYIHVLRHPERGTFVVDTGVERAVANRDPDMRVSAAMASVMNLDALDVHLDTSTWLESLDQPLDGVFLTHLHFDHMGGLPDIPGEVPIYTGPGEAGDERFVNIFTQGLVDEILEGRPPLREWRIDVRASGPFAGLVDVFGDGSLWGLHVPGHTEGSMAFLARTPAGPELFTGDASHTAWGWEHGVEPGAFSSDLPRSAASFAALRRLAARMPHGVLHLGHQRL